MMPIVRIELLEGRSMEQKRAAAEAVTRELARTCGCKEESVQVIFSDIAKSEWALNGTLLSDA